MIRGIYTTSSAMQYLQEQLDVVANNLANTSTTGYKRNGMTFNQVFNAQQANNREKIEQALPPGRINTYTEFTQGGLKETKNPLDIAIHGDGFFAVETPQGVQYTRDGQFTRSPEGILTTVNGYPVLADSGYVQLQGEKFSVGEDGTMMVNKEIVGKLSTKTFDIREAVQRSDNLWSPVNEQVEVKDAEPQIMQGYLELSNVSIVKEMVDMIALQRWYQANEKAIKTNDDALNKAVNQIAR